MIKEPIERFEYRLKCKNLGYSGMCYNRSGYIGANCHISRGCNGKCRRMKTWDNKNGYKDTEFELLEIL